MRKRYLLRDEAADREAQHVDLLEPECLDECDGVSSHLFERGRDLARATRDASVIEQNNFSLSREAIGHRWIPMVHGASVVLVEDDRHAGCLTEAAIGEADSVGLYELSGRGLVGVSGHH